MQSKGLNRLLVTPKIVDARIAGQARLLQILCLVGLATLSVVPFILPRASLTTPSFYFLPTVAILMLATCIYYARKGRVKVASTLFVTVGWGLITAAFVQGGTIKTPLFGYYLVVVLLAGFLIDVRAAFLLMTMSIAMAFGITYAEANGMIPWAGNNNTALTFSLGIETAKLAMVTTLSTLFVNNLNRAFVNQYKSRAELVASEEVLKEKSAELLRINTALRQSEARYRTLVENAPEAIIVLDGSMGRIVDANDNATNMFGYSREQLLELSFADLSPAEQPAEYGSEAQSDAYLVTMHGGQPTYEWVFKDAEDRNFPVEIRLVSLPSEDTTLIRGSITDISERKSNERWQLQHQRNLQQIISSIPGGVVITSKDGNVVWANDATEELLGCLVEELIGNSMDIFYADPDALMLITEMLFHEGSVFDYQVNLQTFHDDQRWVRMFVEEVIYDDEPAILSIFQDIDEQKRAEESLRNLQKWESLAVLAGGIAHDFNNLLVAIIAQNEIAVAKTPEDAPAQKHLGRAVRAAKRAASLTQQMLAYSGRAQFNIRPINLNQLLSENLSIFEVSIPKDISLETELFEDLPHVMGDAAQMQQIMMNLIINAAQAIGDKPGVISVRTSVRHHSVGDEGNWHYADELTSAGDYVSVEIEDNGSGIPPEALNKIFDPFFTTKTTGSGLGLAAVQGIIRGHDGGLRVRSIVGQGTSFTVLLPAHADHEQKQLDSNMHDTTGVLEIESVTI